MIEATSNLEFTFHHVVVVVPAGRQSLLHPVVLHALHSTQLKLFTSKPLRREKQSFNAQTFSCEL